MYIYTIGLTPILIVDRMGLSENLGNGMVQNRKFSGLNLLFGGLFSQLFQTNPHLSHQDGFIS